MRLFLLCLLAFAFIDSCNYAFADEPEPRDVLTHLAEYCVASMQSSEDPAFGPAILGLSEIADFNHEMADKFFTNLRLMVVAGDLDPAAIRQAAVECNDAWETMTKEQ